MSRAGTIESEAELRALRAVLPKSMLPPDVTAPAPAPAPAAAAPVSPNTKHKVHRVWKGLAEEKLAEMASSLEGAMQNDAKMRELFDHIDLDRSGAIDRHEIEVAMKAAGKPLSPEQLDKMLAAGNATHKPWAAAPARRLSPPPPSRWLPTAPSP